MSGIKLEWKDEGWAQFMADLERVGNAGLHVGIDEKDQHPSGRQTAAIAAWNEYGTEVNHQGRPIPERPAFRTTVRREQPRLARRMAEAVKGVLGGRENLEGALQEIGDDLVQSLREAVQDWAVPPNAARTIKRKGENNPLVETKHLQSAIQAKVDGAAKVDPRGRGSKLRDPLTGRFV